jgi:hypothetical protein
MIHRWIFEQLQSKNPAVMIHCGIFEQLHTKDPVVSKSSRDFRTTALRKSRGLRFIAGFSNDFTPRIRRSPSHCVIFGLHSKNPAVFIHRGIFGRLHSKIPRSRIIAGFSNDISPKIPLSSSHRGICGELDYKNAIMELCTLTFTGNVIPKCVSPPSFFVPIWSL